MLYTKEELKIEIAELEAHLIFDPSDKQMREDLIQLKRELRERDLDVYTEYRIKRNLREAVLQQHPVLVSILIPQHEFMFGIDQGGYGIFEADPRGQTYHIFKHRIDRYVKSHYPEGTSWVL